MLTIECDRDHIGLAPKQPNLAQKAASLFQTPTIAKSASLMD